MELPGAQCHSVRSHVLHRQPDSVRKREARELGPLAALTCGPCRSCSPQCARSRHVERAGATRPRGCPWGASGAGSTPLAHRSFEQRACRL